MRAALGLLVAAALAGFGVSGNAAPLPASTTPAIQLSPDGETIYLVGELTEGSFLKFDAALLDAPKVRRVYLASIGGLTIEGRLIAALVRKRRLDTYVEYYCASACTQVFVAGRERVIGKDAQLGFHQAVVVDKDGQAKRVRRATDRRLSPMLVFGINGNDTLRLAYEQAGIDPAFVARVLEQPHSDMWIPAPAELQAARVITRQSVRPEIALPPGGYSHAGLQDMLGRRVLWAQTAKSSPDLYREAVSQTWLWANSGVALNTAIESSRSDLIKKLSPRLLTASDAQLDRLLIFHARIGREERESDYPLCAASALGAEQPVNPRKAAVTDEEDRLIAGIIASAPSTVAPSRDQAINNFGSEVMPAVAKAYRRGDADDSKGGCRYTYRIYESIAALPAERRIKAYRAMLALPKFLIG